MIKLMPARLGGLKARPEILAATPGPPNPLSRAVDGNDKICELRARFCNVGFLQIDDQTRFCPYNTATPGPLAFRTRSK